MKIYQAIYSFQIEAIVAVAQHIGGDTQSFDFINIPMIDPLINYFYGVSSLLTLHIFPLCIYCRLGFIVVANFPFNVQNKNIKFHFKLMQIEF